MPQDNFDRPPAGYVRSNTKGYLKPVPAIQINQQKTVELEQKLQEMAEQLEKLQKKTKK